MTDGFTLDRRALLGGVGIAAFMPRLALAKPAAEPLPRVAALAERWVAPGKLPGMVAAIGLPGREPQFVIRGSEAFGDPDAMTPDSLFRLYSMTKPITGMAAMILIDEGKLRLDQPLADVLPKFARMQVQVVPDGTLTEVRPAKAAITIRHLLTHTAGLAYGFLQKGPLRQAFVDRGLIAGRVSRVPLPGYDGGTPAPSLEAFADRLAELPLLYEPGSRWSYSAGFDLLGRVIEVASGRPFDAFLRERILDPAGMTSTGFRVPKRDTHRLTTSYLVFGGVTVPVDKGDDSSIFTDAPPFPMGGAGLVGSPRDYDRFLAMLARFGRIEGKRVMSERAVRLGTGNLLPAGAVTGGTRMAGFGFGAGGRVGSGNQAGTFGWTGAAGTIGFVDLARGLRAGLYAQYTPSDAFPIQREFQDAVLGDLGGRKPA